MSDKNKLQGNVGATILNKLSLPETLLFAGVFMAFLWSVYFALVIILFPHQIFWNEGTAQVQTLLFLRGVNPFVLENQPFGMNNYGLGYSLAVLPFAALFGNTLLVHRFVTFAFIIFSAFAGFLTVHQAGKDKLLGLTCAAFITVGLVTGQGIGAFPSAMGTFFFLMAVLWPPARGFDRGSLFASAAASLIAFYTKPYFVFSFAILASYLFLFVSKKKGLFLGLFFTLGFLVLLLIFRFVFPAYFINTIMGNIFNSMISPEHLLRQLKELFFAFLPILMIVFFTFIDGYSTEQKKTPAASQSTLGLNILEWEKPFLDQSPGYLVYALLFSFTVFVLVLGQHAANNLYYAYQLILPLFFCWFFSEIAPRNKAKMFLVLMILINLFLWEGKLLHPAMLKQDNSEEWAELMGYMSSSKDILNAPTVVSDVISLGLTPVDSGQTIFFYNVRPYPETILSDISYEQIRTDGFMFEKLIDRRIEKQKYDLVITVKNKGSFFDYNLVEKYYHQVSEVSVNMPIVGEQWTMLVWKPRP